MITLEECRAADQADPLRARRDFFDLPQGTIYLDGNSLGPPAKSIQKAVDRLLVDWRERLIDGWWESGWVELPRRVGIGLEPIIGAEASSIVCTDSTSVNLFKAVTAMCDLNPGDLLTDVGNFPSCLYLLDSIARQHRRRLRVVRPEEVAAAIDTDVGVVSLTQVDFRTGRSHDLETITSLAASAGARTVWDLSHSAGVVPVDLAGSGVDAAVGCGYKYLNGGPGAPAFIYLSPHLPEATQNPINGWFSHRAPFDFSVDYVPADGIDRMRTGTPPTLSMVALLEALRAFDGVDMKQVRAKSVALTTLFIELVEQADLEVLTPREPRLRGSQVSLLIPQASELMLALRQEGIVGDFRPPDVARFGFSPLYNGFEDVWRAGRGIGSILARL